MLICLLCTSVHQTFLFLRVLKKSMIISLWRTTDNKWFGSFIHIKTKGHGFESQNFQNKMVCLWYEYHFKGLFINPIFCSFNFYCYLRPFQNADHKC